MLRNVCTLCTIGLSTSVIASSIGSRTYPKQAEKAGDTSPLVVCQLQGLNLRALLKILLLPGYLVYKLVDVLVRTESV